MSIAVLSQVYDEARRLAVAGSAVARGDFRLKKLLPPLEAAGAKAPVFARVAEAAKAVVEGPEKESASRLLELTSLVTAVLYTQGETGLAGPLEPIESVDLGATTQQTSARLLKPLLGALTGSGSGRLEPIREAHERGAFRDLRLVKPALGALNDGHHEIADFVAENVLPIYGKAIVPELRKGYDPKGTKGQPRRLKLLHRLDPEGSRELVKEALDAGTAEVKVAAIRCLGEEAEDLSFLIESSRAKSKEVRSAAYHALAGVAHPDAVAVLEKAITGKDLDIAASAIKRSTNQSLPNLLVAEIAKALAELPKTKEKKEISEKCRRVVQWIQSLPAAEHAAADAQTLELFARRADLDKIKGDTFSGKDIAGTVIHRMGEGPKALKATLARAHAELDSDDLEAAFEAGRDALPAAELFDLFSPYISKKAKAAKKGQVEACFNAVVSGLGGDYIRYWYNRGGDDRPAFDPRWLEAGLKAEHLGIVHALGKPGHAGINAFLTKLFDADIAAKGKAGNHTDDIVATMARVQHPGTADALVAAYEKYVIPLKGTSYSYWYYRLIPTLPKAAIPALEALVPKLLEKKENEADQMLQAIEELRAKAE